MINIKLATSALLDQNVGCYIVLLEDGFAFNAELKDLAKKTMPQLQQLMKNQKFTGALMSTLALPIAIKDRVAHLIFVGLGKASKGKKIEVENYRRAVSHGIRQASALKYDTVAIGMPAIALFGTTAEFLAKQTAIIAPMALYHFNEFFSDADRRGTEIEEIILCVDAKVKKEAQSGLDDGLIIAQAVNKARHWVDSPPSLLHPPHLAEKAQQIAKKHNLKITVFSEKQINEMGMGGLSAVSQGSDLDCKLVIMEYKTTKKNAPTIAFVGKGITFDSGGLSIKPADYMENMKDDMSGAAAVIATMEVLAQLKPHVNVLGVAPLAENLPSGKAAKPGDIATFYNGKTAEIKNTDAEGRLILADALSYTVKHYKPDAIMDIATLTGACSHFLGPFYTGLMSLHDEFVEKVEHAAELSGERVWRLPLCEDYKPAIKSNVADLSNIGSSRYRAGAMTAAWFLNSFVNDVPWVHLDIAGTAFDVPDLPYYRPGATGVGVRLMVELAMNWK